MCQCFICNVFVYLVALWAQFTFGRIARNVIPLAALFYGLGDVK